MIYEGTITFTAIDKNGNDKMYKEAYIVDNIECFGECESILYEKLSDYTDVDVVSIRRSKITEIANKRESDTNKVFIADVTSTFVDDNGDEKYTVYKVALFADSFDRAKVAIENHLKQGYGLELTGLKQSRIIDVIIR